MISIILLKLLTFSKILQGVHKVSSSTIYIIYIYITNLFSAKLCFVGIMSARTVKKMSLSKYFYVDVFFEKQKKTVKS